MRVSENVRKILNFIQEWSGNTPPSRLDLCDYFGSENNQRTLSALSSMLRNQTPLILERGGFLYLTDMWLRQLSLENQTTNIELPVADNRRQSGAPQVSTTIGVSYEKAVPYFPTDGDSLTTTQVELCLRSSVPVIKVGFANSIDGTVFWLPMASTLYAVQGVQTGEQVTAPYLCLLVSLIDGSFEIRYYPSPQDNPFHVYFVS